MASLDDIWDAPAEPSSSRPRSPSAASNRDGTGSVSPRPAKRPGASSRPLFLDSDSDNEAAAQSNSRYASKPASNKPDIDAFFADLDDDPELAFQDLAPSLDVAALKRQADAKLALTPHQILPSSSPPRDLSDGEGGGRAKGRKGDKKDKDDDGPARKKGKRRARLDEARLVSPNGFPALVKQAKEFKPKGKGHELQDLNRLMNLYQFWAHSMYANTHFADTIQRVEKLCHSKRMNVALSVWRDEAKGLINGHKIPGPDDPSDSEDDGDSGNNNTSRSRGATQEPQDVPVATDDERSSPARSARGGGASLPPSSPSSGASSLGALDEDFDIDAMIREDEAIRALGPPPDISHAPPQTTYGAPRATAAVDDDEDAAMWDAVMDDLPDEPYVPPNRQPAALSALAAPRGGVDEDMDEDMWDMVREMEAESAAAPARPSGPAPPVAAPAELAESQPQAGATGKPAADPAGGGGEPSGKATNDEGWDEMYA